MIANRNSAAPVLRARRENRDIVFIRQNLPPNCYRRITSISVVCHLPRGAASPRLDLTPLPLEERGLEFGHCLLNSLAEANPQGCQRVAGGRSPLPRTTTG